MRTAAVGILQKLRPCACREMTLHPFFGAK
jgi:hypothetical protein